MGFLKRLFGAKEKLDEVSESDLETFHGNDVQIVQQILLKSLSAREFVRLATKNGFRTTGEDQMGLKMSGPNSALILTVLASRGVDNIFTLSIKQVDQKVVSLVDDCKLIF